jgi:outer membrane protein assembly factor BamB
MKRSGFGLLALVTVVGVAVAGARLVAATGGQDWPQFRGLNRDGVSTETGLLGSWPADGPAEVWRAPIGEGYSSIAVVGERIYTMYAADHEDGAKEFAAAFDAKTGKEIWRVPISDKYETEFGNGPRSTPTVDGDSVYVVSSVGDVAALAAADGAKRWEVNVLKKVESNVPHWGYAVSAIVDGDQVVLEAGGAGDKSYVALNKTDGEVRWTHGDGGRGAGYNSPLRVEIDGKVRYVYITGGKLVGIDPDGKEIWSHDWPRGETHAIPVFVEPNKIFASGAEGVGAMLLGVGEVDGIGVVEELWKTRFMRNHFHASVVVGDHVYGFDNATFKCISLADGSLAWAKRGLGRGSLVAADGKLFVLSDQGRLMLVEASPEAYVEHGSVQALEGKSWTPPTLSHGKLFLRNHTEMVVYDLKG